jgi:hypothetical protein
MTEPSDDLVERFRAALPHTDEVRCPSAEEYWAAAVGELPFERLQSLVDHGASCAECAEAWRILGELRHEPDVAPGAMPLHPPAPEGHRPLMGRAFAPLMITAIAAGALWVAFRPAPIEPPSVERGNGSGSFHAESRPVQPPGNAVLRWSEVPGATSYNVTVLTQDLVVVHRSVGLSSRELRLPEAVGQRAAGTGLLWNVDAVLPDGRTVASPTFEVRLGDGR